MSDVTLLECLSCGSCVSGVRTEFGSFVVPGHEGCPRCGSAEFAEAASDPEATDEGEAEAASTAETETEPDTAAETRTEN